MKKIIAPSLVCIKIQINYNEGPLIMLDVLENSLFWIKICLDSIISAFVWYVVLLWADP